EAAQLLERLAIDLSEPGRRAVLIDAVLQPCPGRERDRRRAVAAPVGGIVGEAAELADFLRPAVIGLHRLQAEGPALEIEAVEGPAPARPMIGAAAEIAQPVGFDRRRRLADKPPVIKLLGCLLERQAAALE